VKKVKNDTSLREVRFLCASIFIVDSLPAASRISPAFKFEYKIDVLDCRRGEEIEDGSESDGKVKPVNK